MKKEIIRRTGKSTELPDSIPKILRRIYTARGVSHPDELKNTLSKLADYRLLKGIFPAVELLFDAMRDNKKVVIVGDFDTDGATSTALMVIALKKMGMKNIDYLIPDRFEQGYGLCRPVAEQALKLGAELIVTVDTGISSVADVDFIRSQGVKVIITDHHLPGKMLPAADAIINPNLPDCEFPSKNLAGVGVAFYFMIALRAFLREQNWFVVQQMPEYNLAELLDLVALGTVADVVALDHNNRILVYQGLNRIRAGLGRVGIQTLLEVAKKAPEKITATDLGFSLAPRLNAAGRLDKMALGVELLMCDDPAHARALAFELNALNIKRKEIEVNMKAEAINFCEQLTISEQFGISLFNREWHQGVIGILAARIKDRFYRPVVVFAQANDNTLKGSARSIPGLHIRNIFEEIYHEYPDLILHFGGHAMAAGLTIPQDKFEVFKTIFSDLVEKHSTPALFKETITTDGMLEHSDFTIETAELLRQSGPWGMHFPEPVFDGKFRLLKQMIVAEKHVKVWLEPESGGPMLEGIAFNIDRRIWPDPTIKYVEAVYRMDVNEFRGNRSFQLLLEHLWVI